MSLILNYKIKNNYFLISTKISRVLFILKHYLFQLDKLLCRTLIQEKAL